MNKPIFRDTVGPMKMSTQPDTKGLSELENHSCSETDSQDENGRFGNKAMAVLPPEDYADYKLGVLFLKTLEVIFLLLLALAVCFLTAVVANAITPTCIQNCLAFGMCLVLSVAGLVAGISTLIGGIVLMIRHAKKRCPLGKRLFHTIILVVSVMTATLCAYCYFLQVPRHVGKHECRLIPWSP